MTELERLALAVSARPSGDDLVLVLDYAAALRRETRIEALSDAYAIVMDRDHHGDVANIEQNLREMIERERAQ